MNVDTVLARSAGGEPLGMFADQPFALNPEISNEQASLDITMTVLLQGIYPSRDGPPGGTISLGYVVQYAANFAPRGSTDAEGQLLPISQNTALFSILGTTYGGDGRTTFQLPDFEENLAIGAGQGTGLPTVNLGQYLGSDTNTLTEANLPGGFGGEGAGLDNYETSLGVNYVIHTAGSPTSGSANFAGSVHMFLGNFDPSGAMICNGRLLSISQYPELFAAIGTIYGGDGITNFRIPDLRGKTIIGADEDLPVGTLVGADQIVITQDNLPTEIGGDGQAIDNQQPGVAMQVLIAYQGVFPSRSMEPGSFMEAPQTDGTTATLSQIVFYAGTGRPTYYFPAQGQLLPISGYSALFSLLGTNFGGDGRTTFALPDFGGRVATHAAGQPGATRGQDEITIVYDNIPGRTQDGDESNNTITGSDGDDTFYGLSGYDILIGNGGNDQLFGGDHIDTLDGGEGADILDGGLGGDLLRGGKGNDTYVNVDQFDTIEENLGQGIDTVLTDYSGYVLPENVDNLKLIGGAYAGYGNGLSNQMEGTGAANFLDGGTANDVIDGLGGDDILRGGDGSDVLLGRAGADTLRGDKGKDKLFGNAGDDIITGDGGDDLIVGGPGRDRMTGNEAADTFQFYDGDFAGTTASSADIITDFSTAQGDRIDLSSVDAITGGGDDAFTFIGTAAFSGSAGELRYSQMGGLTMVEGDTNGDGAADFAIRLNGTIALDAANFVL